jgi:hypothetical protein
LPKGQEVNFIGVNPIKYKPTIQDGPASYEYLAATNGLMNIFLQEMWAKVYLAKANCGI